MITHDAIRHLICDGMNVIGEVDIEYKYLTSDHRTPVVRMYKGHEAYEIQAQVLVDFDWKG